MRKQADSNRVNTNEWLREKLYPQLFEKLNRAFPELRLKRRDSLNWESQIDLNGSPKTTVTNQDGSYWLLGHDGEVIDTFVGYIMNRDKTDYYEAIMILANVIKLDIPEEAKEIINANKKKNKMNRGTKNFRFDLEIFFRIALGCVAIFFGIMVITMGTWRGLLLCVLGIMIMSGINRNKSRY